MSTIKKTELVVLSALSVDGFLNYNQLERLRAILRHNPHTFYRIIKDMEAKGMLKAHKRAVNMGSHARPRNVEKIVGVEKS